LFVSSDVTFKAELKIAGTTRPTAKVVSNPILYSKFNCQGRTSSDKHQVAADFTDGLMELLLVSPQSTSKEADAQAQQQIRQDGTEDSRLDDGNRAIAAANKHHEQDDFDDRAKSCFEECSEDVRKLPSKLLPSEANQISGRDHCDVAEDEDPKFFMRAGISLCTN
jgi:hypothetical protein